MKSYSVRVAALSCSENRPHQYADALNRALGAGCGRSLTGSGTIRLKKRKKSFSRITGWPIMTQHPHSLADLATQFPPLLHQSPNHQRRKPQRMEPMSKSSIPPGDFFLFLVLLPFVFNEKSPKLGCKDDFFFVGKK